MQLLKIRGKTFGQSNGIWSQCNAIEMSSTHSVYIPKHCLSFPSFSVNVFYPCFLYSLWFADLISFLGMEEIDCSKIAYLKDYLDTTENIYIRTGPAPRIRSKIVPEDYFTCR